MGRLKGRIALVCGASMGIGSAIAKRFQDEGAEVHGLARSEDLLAAMELDGYLVQDLDDLDALSALELPAATILVNNTGGPPHGSILEVDPYEFGKAFRRHVMASHVLVRGLLPHMKTAGFGRILNVVSTSVREPIPDLGVSNTVRAAMAGYLLRRWNVDCTERGSLEGAEYQLWLQNRFTLRDVDNLAIAPGYAEPK